MTRSLFFPFLAIPLFMSRSLVVFSLFLSHPIIYESITRSLFLAIPLFMG